MAGGSGRLENPALPWGLVPGGARSPLLGRERCWSRALGPNTRTKLCLSQDFHEQVSGGEETQVYAIDHPSTTVAAGPATWPLTDRKCDGMTHV